MGQETMITPSVTVTEKYESNSLFDSEGEDVWESVTMVSPQLDFTREYTKAGLSGSVGAGFEYFADKYELNNERYNADLKFDLKYSPRFTFAFTETFSFTPDSMGLSTDPFSDINTGIQVERNDVLSNLLGLSISRSLNPAVSIGLTLSDSIIEYEASSLTDTRSSSVVPFIDIGKSLDLTSRTSLSSNYSFTRFYLESDEEKDTKDTHSLLLGLNHRFSPGFSFNLSGGVVYTSETGFNYDFIGDTGLTKSTKKSQISLVYSRKVATTSGLTNDLGISQGISFNITSTLTKRFSISMSSGIGLNRSKPSDEVDILSYNTGVSGSWQPYTWMSINAGYSYFRQETDGTRGEDISRDTVFLDMKLIPAVWRF